MNNKYYELQKELQEICKKIRPYYDIDKIKYHSVYIWTKDSHEDVFDGENVFDIQADQVIVYDGSHVIIEETKPIIKEIQAKLKEIEIFLEN